MSEPIILRKLGAAEIVYDYELRLKNMILPITLVFDSKIDLFDHRSKVDAAIRKWKSLHPLLGARVVSKPDADPSKFSKERFFAKASDEKIASLDNVSYMRLLGANKNTNLTRYVDLLNEREMNIETVDSENGLLWRLMIVELSRAQTYALIFTAHHAIIDAKNGFTLVNQLLDLTSASIDLGKFSEDLRPFELNLSIEEKLFGNDQNTLRNMKANEKFEFSPDSKIPRELGSNYDFVC